MAIVGSGRDTRQPKHIATAIIETINTPAHTRTRVFISRDLRRGSYSWAQSTICTSRQATSNEYRPAAKPWQISIEQRVTANGVSWAIVSVERFCTLLSTDRSRPVHRRTHRSAQRSTGQLLVESHAPCIARLLPLTDPHRASPPIQKCRIGLAKSSISRLRNRSTRATRRQQQEYDQVKNLFQRRTPADD